MRRVVMVASDALQGDGVAPTPIALRTCELIGVGMCTMDHEHRALPFSADASSAVW